MPMSTEPKPAIPWLERITILAVHPDAATRDDVARLSAELMAARHALFRIQDFQYAELSLDAAITMRRIACEAMEPPQSNRKETHE
jgi:hypothetical protein